MINKSIPNLRKLVCIFGGVMPQTRTSHAAPPQAPTCVNWDDDMDDFMPPKSWPPTHDVPPPVHECRSRKERKGKPRVRRAILHHLQHHHLSTGMTIIDDFMP